MKLAITIILAMALFETIIGILLSKSKVGQGLSEILFKQTRLNIFDCITAGVIGIGGIISTIYHLGFGIDNLMGKTPISEIVLDVFPLSVPIL